MKFLKHEVGKTDVVSSGGVRLSEKARDFPGIKLFHCLLRGRFILIAVLILTTVSGAYADGGARPISMGRAFIAVADDAHAVSWNPAGMTRVKQNKLTYTATVSNREDYIFSTLFPDDYFAYVEVLYGTDGNEFQDYGRVGISYEGSGYKISSVKAVEKTGKFSYAKEINKQFSLGISLEYKYISAKTALMKNSEEIINTDIACLWEGEKITIGVLWENITEPSYNLLGEKIRILRILRPGLSWQLNENTVVAWDIYDITGRTDKRSNNMSQDINLGIERYFNDRIILRFGAMHINSSTKSNRALTFGFGWRKEADVLFNVMGYDIDYCLVYWADPLPGNDNFTHQLSLSGKI
ncbi:MAG: hypothetical protein ABH952_10495 [Candidatus Omnitrophota bacterium]